jgi:pimeloyl-ACP methyl ester carboxylesterase
MPVVVKQESLMVPVTGKVQLHMRRLWTGEKGTGEPVLMIHGIAEDGHIFYSHSGLGLACYLARNGCEVFVPDMRGKGKSWPSINQHSEFGFHEVVTEDIPALAATVSRLSGGREQTWITHSLGGVLVAAALARRGQEGFGVRQIAHFAARRLIRTTGFRRRLMVDLLWNRIGRVAVSFEGYLPAAALGLGTAAESRRCFLDAIEWSTREQWIDAEDGFDYGATLARGRWLRSLYFASATDRAFGSADDVRDFMHELGRHDGRMLVLGRAGGNLRDYSHTGMLLNPEAEADHFPQLLDWMRER